nr:peptide-methionine (R)-S-oxide reductase MsrB [Candidatus Sulfidibacterium hydrothermale]
MKKLFFFILLAPVLLFGQQQNAGKNVQKVKLSEKEWMQKLSPQQYQVMRACGTEPPFTGKYIYNKKNGNYYCAACGALLFSSDTKYDSGSGWPSFYAPANNKNIIEVPDTSHGMNRIEIKCAHCGSHLGHVFPDGPRPTGLRYCVNSLALDFRETPPKKQEKKK